jgi:porin
MHAETAFGQTSLTDAGAFAMTNTNLLWPLAGEQVTAISGFLYLQALNEEWSLAAGKINVLDFWTMFYPNAGYGQEGFMNLNSLSAGLPWFRFINLSINGAGILAMEGEKPQGFVFAFDLNNSSTTSGLSNLFDDGAGVLGAWKFFTEYGGKPGSHLFVGGYANRRYTSLDETSWFVVPGQGVVPGEKTGAWALGYYFDQVVWNDPCNEARKLQLFTGWGISDGNPSFSRWGGFASLERFGTFRGRDKDRMGISYFYSGLSDDFRQLVDPVVQLGSVQGGEFYYNYEVTPWFHLTGDLQVVDNGIETDDTAVILGLRATLEL